MKELNSSLQQLSVTPRDCCLPCGGPWERVQTLAGLGAKSPLWLTVLDDINPLLFIMHCTASYVRCNNSGSDKDKGSLCAIFFQFFSKTFQNKKFASTFN